MPQLVPPTLPQLASPTPQAAPPTRQAAPPTAQVAPPTPQAMLPTLQAALPTPQPAPPTPQAVPPTPPPLAPATPCPCPPRLRPRQRSLRGATLRRRAMRSPPRPCLPAPPTARQHPLLTSSPHAARSSPQVATTIATKTASPQWRSSPVGARFYDGAGCRLRRCCLRSNLRDRARSGSTCHHRGPAVALVREARAAPGLWLARGARLAIVRMAR